MKLKTQHHDSDVYQWYFFTVENGLPCMVFPEWHFTVENGLHGIVIPIVMINDTSIYSSIKIMQYNILTQSLSELNCFRTKIMLVFWHMIL